MRARSWILIVAAVCLTACASFVGLFVSGRDTIKVPHALHVKAGVECTSCHETIFDSTNLTTHDFSKEKQCLSCHKEQKANCGFCHTDPQKPATVATRVSDLKLNHAAHLERVKDDCSTCHQKLPEPIHTEGMAPTMASCLNCHEHAVEYAAGKCEVCHKDLTKYQLKPVADFSHRGDWLKDHRLEARSTGAVCANCHEQTFCSECHAKTAAVRVEVLLSERVDRSFIHRNDFLSRHPIEAKANESMCQSCHGINFCQSCHAKNQLNPGSGSTLDPHPAGFGAAHGPAARRDIVSCASCHDQGAASNCVSCHRVGGVGGTPHPPTWMLRHDKEEIRRNAMCLVCHL